MAPAKKTKDRRKLLYIDEDVERFEARLHKNASAEPRVPAMISTKGKRTRFTGLTTRETVAALNPKKHARKSN